MTRLYYRDCGLIAIFFVITAVLFALTGSNLSGFSQYYNTIFHRSNFVTIYLPLYLLGLFRINNYFTLGEVILRFGSFAKIMKRIELLVLKYSLMIVAAEIIILTIALTPFCGTYHLTKIEFYHFLIAFIPLQLVGWIIVGSVFFCIKLTVKRNLLAWIIIIIIIGIPALYFGVIETSSQIEYLICIYKNMFIIEGNNVLGLAAHGVYMVALLGSIINIMTILLGRMDHTERNDDEKNS